MIKLNLPLKFVLSYIFIFNLLAFISSALVEVWFTFSGKKNNRKKTSIKDGFFQSWIQVLRVFYKLPYFVALVARVIINTKNVTVTLILDKKEEYFDKT